MIVDDQAHIRAGSDWQDGFGHAADFFERRFFCAQLDQISTTVAELLRDEFRLASIQIGGVHERVKFALGEWFHRVLVNIVCYSQPERKATAAIGPLKSGENIIHCNHRAQARRRAKARSQASATACFTRDQSSWPRL